MTALEVDILTGLDIFGKDVLKSLFRLMSSGRVLGLALATPCGSFSAARRAPRESRMPSAVRSRTFPWGLPDLDGPDVRVAEVGNSLAKVTYRIISHAIRHRIPFTLENPATSLLWQLPCFVRLLRGPHARATILDQCQYGAACRKRTQIVASTLLDTSMLCRRCGQRGLCTRTRRPHVVLSGKEGGAWMTGSAKVYPAGLCTSIAQTFRAYWARAYADQAMSALRPSLPTRPANT